MYIEYIYYLVTRFDPYQHIPRPVSFVSKVILHLCVHTVDDSTPILIQTVRLYSSQLSAGYLCIQSVDV